MQAIQLNRFSARVLIVLSLIALCTVATGYLHQPGVPETDEGTGAHIFQLTIVLTFLAGLLFLTTADWHQPVRSLRPLVVPGVALLLAFAALYYLEHVYLAPRG